MTMDNLVKGDIIINNICSELSTLIDLGITETEECAQIVRTLTDRLCDKLETFSLVEQYDFLLGSANR